MVMHYNIPMLFYDCIKRTYQFTEWNDTIRNRQRQQRQQVITSDDDDDIKQSKTEKNKKKTKQIAHVDTSLQPPTSSSLSSLPLSSVAVHHPLMKSASSATAVGHETDSILGNDKDCENDDDISSTQDESSFFDDDDDEDEVLRNWFELRRNSNKIDIPNEEEAATSNAATTSVESLSSPSSFVPNNDEEIAKEIVPTVATQSMRTIQSDQHTATKDYNNIWNVLDETLALVTNSSFCDNDENDGSLLADISRSLSEVDALHDRRMISTSHFGISNGENTNNDTNNANNANDYDNSSYHESIVSDGNSTLSVQRRQQQQQLRTVPFVSLDINWGTFAQANTVVTTTSVTSTSSTKIWNDTNNDNDRFCSNYDGGNPIKPIKNNKKQRQVYCRPSTAALLEPQSEPAAAGNSAYNSLKLRIPIPTQISFVPTECLLSLDSDNAIVSNSNYNQQEQFMDEIYDPTDPFICGCIDKSFYESIHYASEQLNIYLMTLHNSFCGCCDGRNQPMMEHQHQQPLHQREKDIAQDNICDWIQSNPISCQVKYLLPGYDGPCYPLSYFCSIGFVRGLQVAYNAYPEAIGYCDTYVGTPLHYALLSCHSNTTNNVIELIQELLRLFPEAVRLANHRTEKRTPLHSACILDNPIPPSVTKNVHHSSVLPNVNVIELLLRYYPSAVQLSDNVYGMTPIHAVCQWNHQTNIILDENNVAACNDDVALVQYKILKSFLETSPMAVHSVTTDMQKPLHIACTCGAPTEILKLLLQYDPYQMKFTDDHFQTPLHKAVQALTLSSSLSTPPPPSPPREATMITATTASTPTPNNEAYAVPDVVDDQSSAVTSNGKNQSNCCTPNDSSMLRTPLSSSSLTATAVISSFPHQTTCQYQQRLKNNLTFLVQACPAVLCYTDENDETPIQIANRFGCSVDIMNLLK